MRTVILEASDIELELGFGTREELVYRALRAMYDAAVRAEIPRLHLLRRREETGPWHHREAAGPLLGFAYPESPSHGARDGAFHGTTVPRELANALAREVVLFGAMSFAYLRATLLGAKAYGYVVTLPAEQLRDLSTVQRAEVQRALGTRGRVLAASEITARILSFRALRAAGESLGQASARRESAVVERLLAPSFVCQGAAFGRDGWLERRAFVERWLALPRDTAIEVRTMRVEGGSGSVVYAIHADEHSLGLETVWVEGPDGAHAHLAFLTRLPLTTDCLPIGWLNPG